jgi:hypothetical protein
MDHLQPWQIIAVFPGHKPKPIGRTHNRADADDMVRFLQRKVPTGAFYVVFDPDEADNSNSDHKS